MTSKETLAVVICLVLIMSGLVYRSIIKQDIDNETLSSKPLSEDDNE